MWHVRRMRRWAPALALIGGCRTWGGTRGAPTSAIDDAGRAPVRVTTTDGREVVLNGARVVGDSVVGIDRRHGGHVALDTSQVKRVETRQYSMPGTFFAVLGFLALEVLFSDHG